MSHRCYLTWPIIFNYDDTRWYEVNISYMIRLHLRLYDHPKILALNSSYCLFFLCQKSSFFLLYASIFKSFREHDKRIQYYKQNIIYLEGRTSYPLPSSLFLFDFLCLSLFLLWGVCNTGPHSAVQPCPPTSELSVLTFLRDRHTLV